MLASMRTSASVAKPLPCHALPRTCVQSAALVFVLLCMCVGCEVTPATETFLFFHAEPEVSAEATRLRVDVLGEGLNVEGFPRTDPITRTGTTLARLVLAPIAQDATRTYEVLAELIDEDGVVIAGARVVGGYELEATAELHVWFDPECVGARSCGAGQTCVAGRCVGACYDATSEGTARSEPRCGECERCVRGDCVARDDGAACGCVGDTCSGGACEVTRRFDDIAVGDDVTCVIELGRLFCFGDDADALSPGAPSEFAGFDGVQDLSIGSRHGCVVDRLGAVHCWGWSGDGALGNGDLAERAVAEPRAVPELIASAVGAGGAHTCAIDTEGALRCFGVGSQGQLGRAVSAPQPNPLPPLLEGASEVVAGREHTCALIASELWCFGGNDGGQLGAALPDSQRDEPVCMVLEGEDSCASSIVKASAGLAHTCVVFVDGQVACAGLNDRGEVNPLDPTTRLDALVPIALPSGVAAEEICVGQEHSCVLTTDGEIVCWGDNSDGQLGDDALDGFARIDGSFVALGCGDQFGCALRADGAVICWGRSDGGRLGTEMRSSSAPRRVCIE